MNEKVVHPIHYTWLKDEVGVEPIDICELFNFNLGNALKYILRAGRKAEEGYDIRDKEIEDLKKAITYINREIGRLESNESL